MTNSIPSRTLPEKPSLIQLRKQAKNLLKAYRAGEETAIREIKCFERDPNPRTFALADAQRVLARSYGFSSWTSLKEHVQGISIEAFCAAAETGDIATIRKLAKARPELAKSQRGDERTALHFAVLRRDAEMTRLLMELGADAHAGIWPHRDSTAAYTIAKERGHDEIVAIIELEEERRRRELSSSGATIGTKTDEIIEAILEGDFNKARRILRADLSLLGACNVRGATPLHIAAWTHALEMIVWLLVHDAPVDAKDVEGRTPLDYAALVAGRSAYGKHYAFMENWDKPPEVLHEVVQRLLSRGAELTQRAAVAIGDKQAILNMHREGQLKNEIHTLRGGLISIAVRVNRIDMVELLLDLGLDPNEAVGSESWGMPLWFASVCGRHEIAELLLNRGADVNAIVFACGDALSHAQDDKMIELLLKHGARLTVENVTDAKTAKAILDGTLKAYSLNVTDLTLNDLAQQMLWASNTNLEIVRLCLPLVNLKPDDPWWNYVLVHATLPDTFKLLLEHGVDPDVTAAGYTDRTDLASAYVKDENRVPLATILLDAGASLTRRDPLLKSTPLGWACRWGRRDLVRLYVARGADVVESEAEPWATPLAWATKAGHQEIIDVLLAGKPQ